MLYSFEARGKDCVAIDEPLYREWLVAKKDSVERPYTDAMINATSPDGQNQEQWKREGLSLQERIEAAIAQHQSGETAQESLVVFCKHMAKHDFLYNLENEIDIDGVVHKHVLLVRDPIAVLSSWDNSGDVHGNSPSADEVGIVQMLSIYSTLNSVGKGENVTILDSDAIASDPSGTLQNLCNDLDISWTDRMMTWKSGAHECDGPWAAWWYDQVHKSEGWNAKPAMAPMSKYRTLDPALLPALRASLPAYQFLHSLSHSYANRGPAASVLYEDPRNANLLVWVGAPGRGRLVPRELASISPWDSSVQGGDAAWEGLRVYRGKILSLDRHLRRLIKSSKALGFENVHTYDEIQEAIFRTLAANGMRDGAHMRLTLTRYDKNCAWACAWT